MHRLCRKGRRRWLILAGHQLTLRVCSYQVGRQFRCLAGCGQQSLGQRLGLVWILKHLATHHHAHSSPGQISRQIIGFAKLKQQVDLTYNAGSD